VQTPTTPGGGGGGVIAPTSWGFFQDGNIAFPVLCGSRDAPGPGAVIAGCLVTELVRTVQEAAICCTVRDNDVSDINHLALG